MTFGYTILLLLNRVPAVQLCGARPNGKAGRATMPKKDLLPGTQ